MRWIGRSRRPNPAGEAPARPGPAGGARLAIVPPPREAGFPPAEIEALRARVLMLQRERGLRSLLFTGAYPGDGATTVAVSLATALARDGRREVLLADADLESPRLHTLFNVSRVGGVGDFLAAEGRKSVAWQRVGPGRLYLLPAGRARTAAGGGDPARFDNLLQLCGHTFDAAIFDAAPALSSADTLCLASRVDAVILVISAGGIRRPAARRLRALLEEAGAELAGVVVNRERRVIPEWCYRRL